MSRIGRKSLTVPEKVQIKTDGRKILVKGPQGELAALLPPGIHLAISGTTLKVEAPELTRENGGYRGLVRALLGNMVHGVMHGYERKLEISGVGYKAELKGNQLVLLLGYTHPIHLPLPQGIKAVVDKSQTKISIVGADKQLVGQIAAQIRGYKKPEPYKGKGVKYAEETIRRKVGKAGSK